MFLLQASLVLEHDSSFAASGTSRYTDLAFDLSDTIGKQVGSWHVPSDGIDHDEG